MAKKLTNKMDEIIVVAPRDVVFQHEELMFQGVLTDKAKIKQILDNVSKSFTEMRRGNAEENEAYKQPIPYCVIKRGNEIFTYERLQGGGETRLHNQVSLGVGGHLNIIKDLDFIGIVNKGLERELNEELVIDTDGMDITTIGLINDDDNEVGRVHLGMLVVGHVPINEQVSVRETDQLLGKWMTIEELKQAEVYETLESWSKFVVDIL